MWLVALVGREQSSFSVFESMFQTSNQSSIQDQESSVKYSIATIQLVNDTS